MYFIIVQSILIGTHQITSPRLEERCTSGQASRTMTPMSGIISSEDLSDIESVTDNSTIWDEDSSCSPCPDLDRIILDPFAEEEPRSPRPILSPFKHALVDRIMDEFWTMINQEWASSLTRCAGDTPRSSSSHGSLGNSTGTSSTHMSNKKRQRDEGEDRNSEDNNRKNFRRPISKNYSSKHPSKVVKFACPYRKHAPHTYGIYNYRSCALSHWETVARIKYVPYLIL
jgi:hypothetical protein